MKQRKFAIKSKCKVVANKAGHGSMIGDIVTIRTYSGQYYMVNETSNSYAEQDLQACSMTETEITKEINSLEKEIEILKAKKRFIVEVGIEEYDETLFKTMRILETMEAKKGTKLEKAKIIAKLIDEN